VASPTAEALVCPHNEGALMLAHPAHLRRADALKPVTR
jgi:hypothetical protein